jgi:rhomboid protease GluP
VPIVSLLIVIIYSFINWYFFISQPIAYISLTYSNYWIPFVLPILGLFVFFYQKLYRLNYPFSTLFLYSFIAAVGVIPAMIIAQFYLSSATGDIQTLDNIKNYSQYDNYKNLVLKNYEINKSFAGFFAKETYSDRGSYDVNIYIACPILVNKSDTLNNPYNVWLIKNYYKNFATIYGDLQIREETFWAESVADFENFKINNFLYLRKMPYDENNANFLEAVAHSSKSPLTSTPIFFEAVNEPYEDRNGNKLIWLFFSFTLGQLWFNWLWRLLIKDEKQYDEILLIEEMIQPKKLKKKH